MKEGVSKLRALKKEGTEKVVVFQNPVSICYKSVTNLPKIKNIKAILGLPEGAVVTK